MNGPRKILWVSWTAKKQMSGFFTSWSKEETASHCQSKEASTHKEKGSCLQKEIMQGTMPGGAGEEDHARPGWTTSRHGQDCPWKSQSE